MNLEVGSTVGDYQVIDILGAGGMGKVYKVRNIISDRVEAMKVLLPDLVNEPDLADRFLREIKVQASLEHPNIAALHTAVRCENQLLMLMEFVEGVTLEQKAKGGPLPVAQAVDYIRQVLAALDYAHARGVVHRDIKPANMMLTPSGTVKLMDFGIAKAATDRRLTMTGTTMGSLYYMSPEQIQGATLVDARSDLYSVGVSLYELLTGKRPFDGDSQFAIMAAHLEKTPVPPIEIDPSLPPLLNDVILMSVLKDPNARFQTAGAFRNALGNIAAPAAIAADAIPAAPMLQNPHIIEPAGAAATHSKRGLWMALGAIAAVLAVIAVIQFGPHKGAKASPQPAVAPPAATETKPKPAVTPPSTEQKAATVAEKPPEQQVAAPQQQVVVPPGRPRDQAATAKPVRQQQTPVVSAPPAMQTGEQRTAAPPPTDTRPRSIEQSPATAPAQQAQSQPQPAAPAVTREQLQQAREQLVMLNTRASGIHSSLQSLQRAQAAQGLNLNSRFQGPAALMDQYLAGARDAMNANDLTVAKDFMDKAERQIETLEKLLNR